MENRISKSKFKPHALQYFREVEQTGKEIIITDRGKPVLKIIPFHEEPAKTLQFLIITLRDVVILPWSLLSFNNFD